MILAGVVWWAFQTLMATIPLAEPFRTIVYVLMVLFGVIIVMWFIVQLLSAVGIHVAMPLHLR